jgi:hypothetical protein
MVAHENGCGSADLSDVVRQAAAVHDLQIPCRQAHGVPNSERQGGHTLGVAQRPCRLRVNGTRQSRVCPHI